MPRGPRVDNEALLAAGLELMKANGKPLTRMPSGTRAMIYRLPNGETVRVRTCNDHILVVLSKEDREGAPLNIEGTDWLLLVMPVVERTPGDVMAFLLPTEVPVEEARRTHKEWLATNPNTKGDNRTWNLWLRDDGPEKACGYGRKWARYRLEGHASTNVPVTQGIEGAQTGLRATIDAARATIARAAGVPLSAVRINIDFGEVGTA